MAYKMVAGEKEYCRDGGYSIIAKAHETLVVGKPYHFSVDAGGYLAKDISVIIGTVGVATKAAAAGEYCEFVVKGVCKVYMDAAITAGDGIIPDNGQDEFVTSGTTATMTVGQPAELIMGVALETSAAGGETIWAFIDGTNVTVTA